MWQAEEKRQAAEMQRKLEEIEREEERQEARRRAEADIRLKVDYYEVQSSTIFFLQYRMYDHDVNPCSCSHAINLLHSSVLIWS